jgi:hypothetical protein
MGTHFCVGFHWKLAAGQGASAWQTLNVVFCRFCVGYLDHKEQDGHREKVSPCYVIYIALSMLQKWSILRGQGAR